MKKSAQSGQSGAKLSRMAGVVAKEGTSTTVASPTQLKDKVLGIIRERYEDAREEQWAEKDGILYVVVVASGFEDSQLDRIRSVTQLLRERLNGEFDRVGQLFLLKPEELLPLETNKSA